MVSMIPRYSRELEISRGFYRINLIRQCSRRAIIKLGHRYKHSVLSDAKQVNNQDVQSQQLISNEQKIYLSDPISPGSTFFLPNGTHIFNKLVNFIRLQQNYLFGFKEVITPLIYRKSLWETSGHWQNYKNDMFQVTVQDESKEIYGLKPMNCPGHCVIYKKYKRSYHDLPLRFSDFSPLHRNEASGALSGLTRLRKFHQDDGHIFCTPEQIHDEIVNCLKLVDLCYTKVFNFTKNKDNLEEKQPYFLKLSTRPEEKYIGDIEIWDKAESILTKILNESGKVWELNPGDGAFYGPKIDIMVNDNKNKSHQVATIQLDFQLPQRFDLKYQDKDNTFKTPIMIHRATFGSVERFISILLDSYEGNWPFWLNPKQAIVIPINTKKNDHIEQAEKLVAELKGEAKANEPVKLNSFHFNVDMDARSEPLGYRIKDAIMNKYSYLIIVGDEEVETGKFSIRTSTNRTVSHLTKNEIFEKFVQLEQNYE